MSSKRFWLCPAIAGALAIAAAPLSAPAQTPKILKLPKTYEVRPIKGVTFGLAKADLAAHRIDFQLVAKEAHPLKGTVRIVGVVKNVGAAAYPRSGLAFLEEDALGQGTNFKQVAKVTFPSLAPGQEVLVSYERSWFTAVSFFPKYRLIVTLDPDTPDANGGNNVLVRDGSQINNLFMAAGRERATPIQLPKRR